MSAPLLLDNQRSSRGVELDNDAEENNAAIPLFDHLDGAQQERFRNVQRASSFAVLKLTTSSDLIGCWIGRSPSSELRGQGSQRSFRADARRN
jgi:hypothetical protein